MPFYTAVRNLDYISSGSTTRPLPRHIMFIGKLAKLSGTTPKAIRLYEAIGLLPPARRQGQYRVYSDKDLSLVHMIRRAQAVGFSLAELKELAVLRAQSSRFPVEKANELIAMKRNQLRCDMDRIRSLDQQLIELHEELNRTLDQA